MEPLNLAKMVLILSAPPPVRVLNHFLSLFSIRFHTFAAERNDMGTKIIEIQSLNDPGIEVFGTLTEAQLRNRLEF